MKKQPWTLEKHQEVGRTLRTMHDDLESIKHDLSHSYPNTTGNSGRAHIHLEKALQRIGLAMVVLEDLLASEPAGKELGGKISEIY